MADAEMPDVTGLSAVIPHFHYDLIGRIAPGMYLVLGVYWIAELNGEMPPSTAAPSLATIVAAGLFAYVLGFIIGPLSYRLFDCSCRLDAKDCVGDVLSVMEQNSWKPPSPEMPKPESHEHIRRLSVQSVYMLWQRAPLLAIMTSRWDAEAFAARQFGTATIILVGVTLRILMASRAEDHRLEFILLIVLATGIVFLCYRQFQYSRRRAILSRFVMLASLASGSPLGDQAAAQGR